MGACIEDNSRGSLDLTYVYEYFNSRKIYKFWIPKTLLPDKKGKVFPPRRKDI